MNRLQIDLPVFQTPQRSWYPKVVDWEAVMDETELLRKYYIEHFDSPEERLRRKNPKPFVWICE